AESEEVLAKLEPVVEEEDVEPCPACALLDAESPNEGSEALRELQREAKIVRRRLATREVHGGIVGIRRLYGFLLENRQTARVIDYFDGVVFVFARLQPELHIAL